MRILQILPSFGIGGAEKVVLNYMRAAKMGNLDITTISLYPPTQSFYDRIIEEEKLQVIYLHKQLGMDLDVILELRKEIRKINPDVVHTHLYAMKYYFLTGEFKERKNFHTIHSIPQMDATGIEYWVNRFIFQKKWTIPIALHQGLIEEINKYYCIDSTVMIENGIFIHEYKNAKKSRKLQDEIGISDEDFIIGHVGKFKEAKNHIFMLNLLEEILKIENRAKLLLVGNGELTEKIRAEVRRRNMESKVFFCGNRADVATILKLMDVFVFPSIYEGLGLAVIEAQLAGIRCVVSDAVPKETSISDGIQYLSLKTEKSIWIEHILSRRGEDVHLIKDVEKFDVKYVMEELMKLYGR